jgi:hypothetical protein
MIPRLFFFATSLLLLAGLPAPVYAQSPAGTWTLAIDAAGDIHTSELRLVEQGDTLAGTLLSSDGQPLALQTVRLAGDTLTFTFHDPQHGNMSAHGVVRDDSFSGTMATAHGDFPMTATRTADTAETAEAEATAEATGTAEAAGTSDAAGISEAKATVSGTWQITGDVMGNPIDSVCILEESGASIGGSCEIGGEAIEITGEVTDQGFTFQHGSEYNGEQLTISYSGTLTAPESMEGTVTVDPYGVSGDFSGDPVSERP